jgi:hypothetical protein
MTGVLRGESAYVKGRHAIVKAPDGTGRKKKGKTMCVRTFLGAGRCFVPRSCTVALRQNSVQTRPSGTFAAMSRPHWPLAPQWAPFLRTGPTQGFWSSLELEKNGLRFVFPLKKRLGGGGVHKVSPPPHFFWAKVFDMRHFPPIFLKWYFLNPLAEKRAKTRQRI